MLNRIITPIFSLLFSLVMLAIAVLALQHRVADISSAYDYVISQMTGDIALITQTETTSQEKWKEDGPAEYRKRLMSIDPGARLEAVKAIEEKSDPQFVPQMIKLLNDTTSVEDKNTGAKHQISEAAKSALTKIIKDNIIREPGNMATFIPLFQAGLQGSHAEKIGVIDILSALREPAAYPLLQKLSETRDDPEIASRADNALRLKRPDSTTTRYNSLLTSRRAEFMYVLMAMGSVMVVTAFWGLVKRKASKFAALSVLAILLNLGLGFLVYAELNRGDLTQASLREAVNQGDLLALRTMSHSDYTPYPGDSLFCQRLVQMGNIETVRALIALQDVEPDDLPNLKTNLNIRTRWIMARIVVLNLGSSLIDKIIDAQDPVVNYALTQTLDQLKIQDKQITGNLERLSQSEPERVSKTAEKALSQIKNRPVWPSM